MSALLTGRDIGEAMHVAAEMGAAAVEVLQSVPAPMIEALGATWPGNG